MAAQFGEAARIHKTALVEAGAEVADGTTVGPGTFIEAGAKIGPGCRIGPHVVIHGSTSLGEACSVHAGAVLGDVPQDLAYQGGESWVEIGAHCTVREGVTIHRGTEPGSTTRVAERCLLMAQSHVAHNAIVGANVILCNGALVAGHVQIGDGAFVSGNCVIHQFVRLGRLAMLGGGAAVSQDVPPFCTARPVSANHLLGLNLVGMRRAGLSVAARRAIQNAFALIYRSGLSPKQAAQRIRDTLDDSNAHEMAEFVELSRRGLCRLRTH